MTKKIWILIIIVAFVFIGCANTSETHNPYDEEWMIGKTRAEIEEKYGEFDVFEAGNRDVGRYILIEDRRTILGDIEYGKHLRVCFDEDGKVFRTYIEINNLGG